MLAALIIVICNAVIVAANWVIYCDEQDRAEARFVADMQRLQN